MALFIGGQAANVAVKPPLHKDVWQRVAASNCFSRHRSKAEMQLLEGKVAVVTGGASGAILHP